MLEFIGTTFPKSSQWYEDEIYAIETIKPQIDQQFPNQKNLFINTTWFGPQFDNGQYKKFEEICVSQQFDNVFLLAAADPVFLADYQMVEVHKKSGNGNLYLLGHFDSLQDFNFHSIVLPKYFKSYSNENDLICDFTFGSGSTAIACLNTNRHFVGCEKDKDIFNSAKDRILDLVK